MKLIIFTFFLLINSITFAIQSHTAYYQLSINNLNIAQEVKTLTMLENNKYHYTANAKTSGWASLVKDYEIKAQSIFTINNNVLHSTHYQYFERDGDKVKKNIDIHPTNQQIDPLSLFLTFSQALSKNPNQTDFNFMLNNGKTVKKKHYQQIQSEHQNLVKIINLDDKLEAYFDINQHYLPVLIKRKNFSYKLQSVQFQ